MLKRTKGFTLIELLVVIAIIGILATVIFISLNRGRDKARIAKAQIETRQIGLAIELLYQDTGRWPAHRVGATVICQDASADPAHFTDWAYGPYEDFNCELRMAPSPSAPYLNLMLPWYGLTGLDPGNADAYTSLWSGPYLPLTFPTVDPWGHDYYFDGDWEGQGGRSVRIASRGPNGVENYGGDDITYFICKRRTQPPCSQYPCPCIGSY